MPPQLFIFLLVFTFGNLFSKAGNIYGQKHATGIHWIDFDGLNAAMRQEARPILIALETDWCKYCKLLHQKTFKDTAVVNYLNENFYALRLDAETKEKIRFLGKEYVFQPSGVNTGMHELAVLLGKKDGRVEFPTLVLLNATFQPLLQHVGYIRKKELLKTLTLINTSN